MTETSPDAAERPAPPPLVVTPAPESRLDALAARYATLKPQVEELTEQLDGIKTALKAEMFNACPAGSTDITLASPWLTEPLRLQRILGWRIDAKAMKAEAPEAYVRWAKQSTSWRLGPVK